MATSNACCAPTDTDLAVGLTHDVAQARLEQYGPNALPPPKPKSQLKRFFLQFHNALIYLLLFALAIDLIVWQREARPGPPIEALAIFAIILLNATLGAVQEARAERVLAELERLAAPKSWVLRDGTLQPILAAQLVPGDLVRIEAGDRLPADGIARRTQSLSLDESVLTGESIPVDKPDGYELACGTVVTRGQAFLEVSRTGRASTLGRMAATLSSVETSKTPLERRVSQFGLQIARYVGALTLLLIVVGTLVEGISRFSFVVTFAAALAIAVVPEGMPAVITLALAVGVRRMARRNAVVRRLAAVEALGSVTVIATDKTGTLTENRIAVASVEGPSQEALPTAMVLVNDADDALTVGDPLELGLLDHARRHGIDVARMRAEQPRISVLPFDSKHKLMSVTVRTAHGSESYWKGAAETLIERCRLTDDERLHWLGRVELGARTGHRVLAFAKGSGQAADGLEFLGIALLWDPPREATRAAIERALWAGIRVVMITGDHPTTARAIADEVGLPCRRVATGAEWAALSAPERLSTLREIDVFARTSPEHKLAIVEALQASSEIVAMTGDGLNDAPALKKADVAVAMGRRGSDVAREVSDIVLLDDDFATIVAAVEEGRIIYDNVQKFIRFTFSTNVALMLLIVAAAFGSFILGLKGSAGSLLLPLSAVQLLCINFLGDGPPALALALDRDPDVMKRPPRPASDALLDRPALRFIAATGAFKGVFGLALLVLLPLASISIPATQTAIFLYEALAKLVSAYPSRRVGTSVGPNAWLHAALAFGVLFSAAAVWISPLRTALALTAPSLELCMLVAVAVLATWMFGEAIARHTRAA